MDARVRGVISEIINSIFEKHSILETVDWLLEADSQVRSSEDLALGYSMGELMSYAETVLRTRKADDLSHKYMERKFGKKAAREFWERERKIAEETRAKGGRYRKAIEITKEEQDEIRDMFVLMIARFREKIRAEEALRRV
jgi:hypothetical protein